MYDFSRNNEQVALELQYSRLASVAWFRAVQTRWLCSAKVKEQKLGSSGGKERGAAVCWLSLLALPNFDGQTLESPIRGYVVVQRASSALEVLFFCDSCEIRRAPIDRLSRPDLHG